MDEARASAEAEAKQQCDDSLRSAYVSDSKPLGGMIQLKNGESDPDAHFSDDDPHICPGGLPHLAGDAQIESEYTLNGESGSRFDDCRAIRDNAAHSKVKACSKFASRVEYSDPDEIIPHMPGDLPNYPYNYVCEFNLTKIVGISNARGTACYFAFPGAVTTE